MSYYDLPVVKAAPWKWYVPAYFYAGGLAGATTTLAAFARDRDHARRLHWIALLGELTGSALLVADLGKPQRAHHMLRVFRPSSPMNMGSWILDASATSSVATLAGSRIATRLAAIPASLLTTYTGVLLGNTAIPVWHGTRDVLPPWFAACAAASAASMLELVGPAPSRVYSVTAKAAQLVGSYVVEHAAHRIGVAAPLRTSRLWRASRWLGIASLAATIVRRPRIAGVLGTASAVLARFAIVEAGRVSAADPRATFGPQRT